MPRRLRTAPAGRLFEKAPAPRKTFTLAAKAEGQVHNLPLAGVAYPCHPSSPKRLYLPLRANLHRQVWGLDSVPAPLTAKPHQLFGAAGGAGGNALQRLPSSSQQRRRFCPYNGEASTGADGTSASQAGRRSRRTGQNDGCQGNKGGDFPQGNTTRPLTDGKPERQEKQGLSITGVWGEVFALISKCL